MRNVSEKKFVEKIKTGFMFNNFPPPPPENRAGYEKM
jgi:hypothetical protein